MTGVRAALGVDLGTGSVKVALVGEPGETLRSASRAYDLSSPHPGWAEADPMEWLHATTAAAGQVLDDSEGAVVVGVGFSGQMHGVVLCDENLEPVRPVITWADSRAGDEAADGTTYAERSAMHLLDEAEERHAQVRRLEEPSVCPDHP